MIVDRPTSRLLADTTRFTDIRQLAEVDSTNRFLLDLARSGAPEGMVVVADFQTAGRGRLDRTWEAPPGASLLMSVLLRPNSSDVPPDRRWLVPAAVALAAADACLPRAPEIKWPNDLLLGGAKLAGILAQADGGAIVVGIGINVAWAPPGAASLGASVDRGALLARLLTDLDRWCDRWDDVADAYRRRCATVGRAVRVELAGRAVTGRAVTGRAVTGRAVTGRAVTGRAVTGRAVTGRATGIDADGRLRVENRDEVLLLSVADVVHLTES